MHGAPKTAAARCLLVSRSAAEPAAKGQPLPQPWPHLGSERDPRTARDEQHPHLPSAKACSKGRSGGCGGAQRRGRMASGGRRRRPGRRRCCSAAPAPPQPSYGFRGSVTAFSRTAGRCRAPGLAGDRAASCAPMASSASETLPTGCMAGGTGNSPPGVLDSALPPPLPAATLSRLAHFMPLSKAGTCAPAQVAPSFDWIYVMSQVQMVTAQPDGLAAGRWQCSQSVKSSTSKGGSKRVR